MNTLDSLKVNDAGSRKRGQDKSVKPAPEFPLHLIGYILPLITILVSIPMALGKVKPNRFYGFRTPKTLSSPAVWYPANRACGQYMIIASAVSLVFNLSYWLPHRDLPIPALVLPMAAATVIPMLVSVVASMRFLKKL